jgi:predicted nucleotidyltransferase
MNLRLQSVASPVKRSREVIARFAELERVVLFGSRAKGTAKQGSDIDLALYGEGLDWRVLGRIEDELDDLLLPYTFSLVHHDVRTDSEVAAHIARVGVPFTKAGRRRPYPPRLPWLRARRDSAGGGGRTHTPLRETDFESVASASSATPAES